METNSSRANIIYTIAIGMIGVAFHCFIGFFLTPKITNELGVDIYGYATLARNFVSYASIALLALNAFSARYITNASRNNDRLKFNEYYSSVYIGNCTVGSVLFIIGLFVVIFLQYIMKIPDNYVFEIKILFLLVFTQFFVSIISNVYAVTGYVKDKQQFIQIVTTLAYFVDIVALYVLFWVLEPKVWYIGLASLLVAVFTLFGNYYIKSKYMAEAKVRMKYFSFRAVKILIANGIWSSINSLGNLFNSGLDLLVSNLMLTPVGMGQIAVSKTFLSITSSITSTAAKAFHPTFLKHYSSGEIGKLINDLKLSMRVCAIPTNIIVAGFIAVGLPFLKLWIPSQDINKIYYLIILAFIPSVAEGPMYPLYYINTLTLKNRIPCFVTIAGGLVNVVSMYVLIQYTSLQEYAVLITTAVIMCIINMIFNPIYLCFSLGISKKTFFPNVIRNILSFVITTLSCVCIAKIMNTSESWGTFIIQVLCIGVIASIMQFITLFNPKEIRNIGQRIYHRIHK